MYRRQQAAWGFVPNYAKVVRPPARGHGALGPAARRDQAADGHAALRAGDLRRRACARQHGLRAGARQGAARVLQPTRRSSPSPRAASTACSTPPSRRCSRFARQVATRRVAGHARPTWRRSPRTASPMPRSSTSPPRRPGRAFFTKMLDALGVLADAPMGRARRDLAPRADRRPADRRAPARHRCPRRRRAAVEGEPPMPLMPPRPAGCSRCSRRSAPGSTNS